MDLKPAAQALGQQKAQLTLPDLPDWCKGKMARPPPLKKNDVYVHRELIWQNNADSIDEQILVCADWYDNDVKKKFENGTRTGEK